MTRRSIIASLTMAVVASSLQLRTWSLPRLKEIIPDTPIRETHQIWAQVDANGRRQTMALPHDRNPSDYSMKEIQEAFATFRNTNQNFHRFRDGTEAIILGDFNPPTPS